MWRRFEEWLAAISFVQRAEKGVWDVQNPTFLHVLTARPGDEDLLALLQVWSTNVLSNAWLDLFVLAPSDEAARGDLVLSCLRFVEANRDYAGVEEL